MPSSSLIHADIFFFVSTVALVLIMAAILWAFVYIIDILRNVRDITAKGRAEWEEIVTDSKKLRGALRDEGIKWKHVVDLVRTFFVRDSDKKAAARDVAKATAKAAQKSAAKEAKTKNVI